MEWYLILILVLGILIIILIVVYRLYKTNLTLSPTGKISENIVCIKNRIANVYVYTKNSDRVIIDAGMSTKGIKKELMKMDINPENVTDVFITHSDPDHIGGLSLFSKARIYLGKGSKVKNPEDFRFLGDNDQILVGAIKVQAVSTPGHRLGHTCYLINDEYLFSGDLLRLKVNEIKPFFKFISANYDQLLESIRKIAKIENVKMLLTAHTGYTTDFKRIIEKWKV